MVVGTAIVITLLAAILYALGDMNMRPVTPRAPGYFDDFDHWMSLKLRGK
jgi:hypothetical protein